MEGRDHVLPEDVQAILIPVIAHRLRPLKSMTGKVSASSELLAQLMKDAGNPKCPPPANTTLEK